MLISRGSRGRLTALHEACTFYQTVLAWQNDKCCSFKEGRETHIVSQQMEQRPRGRNEKALQQNKWCLFFSSATSIILTHEILHCQCPDIYAYIMLSTQHSFINHLFVHHINGAVKLM